MTKFLTILFALTMCFTAVQAQIRIPAASPAGSVSTVVGLTDIEIDYFRPKMKGRKIFGEGPDFLVPYGQIWRTGANSGTRISFSEDVQVEGIAVPKGEYLLLTWPGANEWTVSLYKDVSMGGNTSAYDASKDAAKFKVTPEKLTETVETFTINIGDISADNTSAEVQLAWANTSVKFTVKVSFDEQVMKSIEANTKVNPNNLIAAARYYHETKKDLNQALKWVNEALAMDKNPAFWTLHFKAQLQKTSGTRKALPLLRNNHLS